MRSPNMAFKSPAARSFLSVTRHQPFYGWPPDLGVVRMADDQRNCPLSSNLW